jgi:predicted secreted acid phosphatase
MCKDIEIDSKNNFKANCEAYSTEWDEILWNDWVEKVNWTSISVAVSFLNYIQTKSTNFTLINKTKSFSQEATNFWFYIYKTNFILEMKYNGDNLSF